MYACAMRDGDLKWLDNTNLWTKKIIFFSFHLEGKKKNSVEWCAWCVCVRLPRENVQCKFSARGKYCRGILCFTLSSWSV